MKIVARRTPHFNVKKLRLRHDAERVKPKFIEIDFIINQQIHRFLLNLNKNRWDKPSK